MLALKDIGDDPTTLAEVKRGAEDGLKGEPSGEATPGYLTGYYTAAFAKEANERTRAVETMEYDLTEGRIKEKKQKASVVTKRQPTYLLSHERARKAVTRMEELEKLCDKIIYEPQRTQILGILEYAKSACSDVYDELYDKRTVTATTPVSKTGANTYKPKELATYKPEVDVKKAVANAKEEAQERIDNRKKAKATSYGVGSPLGLKPSRLPGATRISDEAHKKLMRKRDDFLDNMLKKDEDEGDVTDPNNGVQPEVSNGLALDDCMVVQYMGESKVTGEIFLECRDPWCATEPEDHLPLSIAMRELAKTPETAEIDKHIQEEKEFDRMEEQLALPPAPHTNHPYEFKCHECSEPAPHFLSESGLINHIAGVHLGEFTDKEADVDKH